MSLARFQQQAAAVANVGIDMSQTSKGGGGRRLLPAGLAFARLIGYREFGNHAREFQGQAKAAAPVIRLTFALWGKGDKTGPDIPENLYHRMDEGKAIPGMYTTFDMVLGNNEKSKTKKAFDKLNWSKKHKGFATMLGETFLLPITHKKSNKPDAKPYNEIDWASVMPPMDPLSGQMVAVPEVEDDKYHMFLWDNPTKEDWDAMFIDGQTDAGKSKNFMQAMCTKAVNFEGSLLQQLLGGALPDFGETEGDEEDSDAPAAQAQALPAVPAQVAAGAAPNVTVAAIPGVPAVESPLPDAGQVAAAGVVGQVAAPTIPAIPGIPGIPGM